MWQSALQGLVPSLVTLASPAPGTGFARHSPMDARRVRSLPRFITSDLPALPARATYESDVHSYTLQSIGRLRDG